MGSWALIKLVLIFLIVPTVIGLSLLMLRAIVTVAAPNSAPAPGGDRRRPRVPRVRMV